MESRTIENRRTKELMEEEDPFSNDSVTNSLLGMGRLEPIEHLLHKKSRELMILDGIKNDLDFGEWYTPQEVQEELFPSIRDEVNWFVNHFGTQQPVICDVRSEPYSLERAAKYFAMGGSILVGPATYLSTGNWTSTCMAAAFGALGLVTAHFIDTAEIPGTYNCYSTKMFRIKLPKKERRVPATITTAHEYTHFIQEMSDTFCDDHGKYIAVGEGQARGAQRRIGKTWSEREGNLAFEYKTTDYDVGELRSVYIWLCQTFGKTPRNDLMMDRSSVDANEKRIRTENGSPSYHALGNTLFQLSELVHGPEIYSRMLKRDKRILVIGSIEILQ